MAGEALLIERALFAAAVVMLMAGAVSAWSSDNAAKRVAGLVIACLGAVIGLAALGAPAGALLAGGAAGFAYLAVGIALLVRLQEAYGGIEATTIDSADAQSEPAEPTP
jgi:hypothetical protein